jgi:hypothetical protein
MLKITNGTDLTADDPSFYILYYSNPVVGQFLDLIHANVDILISCMFLIDKMQLAKLNNTSKLCKNYTQIVT